MTDFRKIWIPLADRFCQMAYYMLEEESCSRRTSMFAGTFRIFVQINTL